MPDRSEVAWGQGPDRLREPGTDAALARALRTSSKHYRMGNQLGVQPPIFQNSRPNSTDEKKHVQKWRITDQP